MTGPLIVRLPNWVGDVVMVVPALRLLAAHGHDLHLAGRPWAGALLAGERWPVTAYGGRWRARVQSLRTLAMAARRHDPDFDRRVNTMVFPNSFSSAWETWCAALRGFGYRHDARRLFLARSVPLPHQAHQLRTYWHLVTAFLDSTAEPPEQIDLGLSAPAQASAAELALTHGLRDGYIVLCPFAQGLIEGQSRRWPRFAEFALRVANESRLPVVVCPGPAEQAEAQQSFPGATILNDIDLGTYAALLQRASLAVANDTGPGHLAAAVGVPLISVLNPSDPARTGPWGTRVTVLKQPAGWPTVDGVLATAGTLLGARGA